VTSLVMDIYAVTLKIGELNPSPKPNDLNFCSATISSWKAHKIFEFLSPIHSLNFIGKLDN